MSCCISGVVVSDLLVANLVLSFNVCRFVFCCDRFVCTLCCLVGLFLVICFGGFAYSSLVFCLELVVIWLGGMV